MKAEIEVLQPGLFSSIQDQGRFGYRKYGVPESGSMDNYAAKMANLILQNVLTDAVLEITQMGPKLKFLSAAAIAVTGGDLSPMVNNVPVPLNKPVFLNNGDLVSFGRRRSGCRAYIAIAGGFQTENVMGSRSWYAGVTGAWKLEKGMKLLFNKMAIPGMATYSAVKVRLDYILQQKITVLPGPEYNRLKRRQKEQLLSQLYRVDHSNDRMAIQLKELFQNNLKPMITGPVVPGTIQLTPGGRLIILMKDCQTTGGYLRILQVTQDGMNSLSQKIEGDLLGFEFQEM